MVSQRRSELGQAVVQSVLSDGEVGYVCNSEVSREQTFSAITALERSRLAADASRELVERWLLDGFDVSVGHRRCSRDPSTQNDAGGTPAP